jgi:hypothetical protein
MPPRHRFSRTRYTLASKTEQSTCRLTGPFVIKPPKNLAAGLTQRLPQARKSAVSPLLSLPDRQFIPTGNGDSLRGERLQDCPYHSFPENRVNSSL